VEEVEEVEEVAVEEEEVKEEETAATIKATAKEDEEATVMEEEEEEEEEERKPVRKKQKVRTDREEHRSVGRNCSGALGPGAHLCTRAPTLHWSPGCGDMRSPGRGLEVDPFPSARSNYYLITLRDRRGVGPDLPTGH
jgi:hypothetical protein